MKVRVIPKIKKPKKKELVALERDLKYYHRIDSIKLEYLRMITNRKEAEKLGYKPCDAGCYNKK